MTIQKKLRKLLRDPKQFFDDMRLKRLRNVPALKPKKREGHSRYTVVSAAYNVGRYLDQYFQSIVDQRLDFRNNITLIMVDDGSTDDSCSIIKRWQRRYPKNIVYLHQENAGQASARNLGLAHVSTEWVTFIDPDDFVDWNYFLEVDKFIEKNSAYNLKLISCNFIFFYEDKNQYSDTHPLKYRFAKGDTILPYHDLQKHLQLSVNSAFFRSDLIAAQTLTFDPRIRPNFEDAHFVGCYLADLDDGHIAFCTQPKYYYRKRSDSSSTLDTAWQKRGLYNDVLEHGCLDLIKRHIAKSGTVPKFIQRTVLYHLIWYVKRITNKPEVVEFLTLQERGTFEQRMAELFSFIEAETILEFELAGAWFFHKAGMLGAFKQLTPAFQIAYIEDFDHVKDLVQIRYFTRNLGLEVFEIDNQDILPVFAKTVRNDFLSRTFVLERRLWLPVPANKKNSLLQVRVDGSNARLTLAKKQHEGGLSLDVIRNAFTSKRVRRDLAHSLWLLMDRDTQADDNAEHLYRYLHNHHSAQPIAFVLRRDSHDWPRLSQEGFNLLAFGSAEHEAALKRCAVIISSHADRYIVDYFGDQSLARKHFVFLQHGVTHNDLSGWLNTKDRIDCFITAAQPEYNSIAGDFNRYKFTKREVVLTGFPRHDSLLDILQPAERLIIIMPTWRKSLLGDAVSGNERARNPDFMRTHYAQAWQSVLQSTALRRLAEQHGYQVMFFPHTNIHPYLAQFEVPAHVEVLEHLRASVQELFQRAALMITDFSSVAFEMAFLRKPIIYYQFDEASFFQGQHIHQQGYFDYRRDGFGPVVTEEEALLSALAELLTQHARPAREYLARMEAFFPFRDGRNCKRVHDAIIALNQPLTEGYEDLEILQSFSKAASHAFQWRLAEERWRRYLKAAEAIDSEEHVALARIGLSVALRHQRRFYEAYQCLHLINGGQRVSESTLYVRAQHERAELNIARGHWLEALEILAQLPESSEIREKLLLCQAEAGLVNEVLEKVKGEGANLAPRDSVLYALAARDWTGLTNRLMEEPERLAIDPAARLLLARSLREQGFAAMAADALSKYEECYGRDSICALEHARLAFTEARWGDAVRHMGDAYPEGVVAMGLSDGLMQVKACRLKGDRRKAHADLAILKQNHSNCIELVVEQAYVYSASMSWLEAVKEWRSLLGTAPEAGYQLAQALRFTGELEEGLHILLTHTEPHERSPNDWQLIAELAQLQGDYSLAAEGWETLLRVHGDHAPGFAWDRLHFARLMLRQSQLGNIPAV